MGARLLAFVAVALLGFAFIDSAGPRAQTPQLYVSPLAPLSYRAAAELPSAILMSEMSADEYAKQQWLAKLDQSWGPPRHVVAAAAALGTEVPAPNGQPDSSYDWRMNYKDWRFQIVSMVPFGLLFIAISLQNSKRAELLQDAEECEITAISGAVPPEHCRQMVAMAAVDGQSPA
jgi:hypothetical protein